MIKIIFHHYTLGKTAQDTATITGYCRNTTQKYFRMAKDTLPNHLNTPTRYFVVNSDKRKRQITKENWKQIWKAQPHGTRQQDMINNDFYMFLTRNHYGDFDKLKIPRAKNHSKLKKEIEYSGRQIKFYSLQGKYHYTSSFLRGSDNPNHPGM